MRTDTATPGRLAAALLAALLHVLFIGFLVFSVNWKSHPPQPVMADLWEALPPPPPATKVQPAPKPEPEPEPEPVAKAPPAAPHPDIALKEKKQQARERQAQLAQQKRVEELQRAKEKQRLEKQQLLQQREAEQRKLAEQEKQQVAQRKQDELKRKQEALRKLNQQQTRAAMNNELARETTQLRQAAQASQLASEQARMEADYQDRIRSKIASMLILPENLAGNPKAIFVVTVLPSGEVAQVRLVGPSGQTAYDTAVERAILKAVPFPLPPDKTVAARFRELRLPIQPRQEN